MFELLRVDAEIMIWRVLKLVVSEEVDLID